MIENINGGVNMEYYKILDTKDVLEFASGLEGEIFRCVGYHEEYIILETYDGRLLFAPNEVEKVSK